MGDNIDNLSFGVVLDSKKFESEMKRVEGLAKEFERTVASSLALTNALEAAQGKNVGNTEKKAKKQKEVVTLTREELELKKAVGTATKAELQMLNALLRNEKLESDVRKKNTQEIEAQVRLEKQQVLLEKSKGQSIQLTTNQLIKQNSVMKGLTSMASMYFSVFGAATIVRNMVRITGEFEAQHTALRAILQDTAAADNIYNQLQVLAVKSPFTFQNLVGYAKQLTAFSVPVNEVYETTKKLADVSAGLGVDLGRIILAYGQVRSAEFLRGQEVRQFTEAGIPILKELADQFKEIEGHAISVGEVFERISARQVPFAMVEEAFNRMTSAGGKFYQMQEVLAETVKGKISNLQDAWEIMLSKIGDQNSGTIKGIVDRLTGLLQNYERWIGLLGTVIKYIGIYGAGLTVLNTITKAYNGVMVLANGLQLANNQQVKLSTILLPTNIALQKLSIKNTEEEAAALATLNLARKAAVGVLAAVSAILWSVIQHSIRSREEARKTTDTINAALSKLSVTMADFKIGADKVDAAFVKMKDAEGDATKETEDFNNAVDDLKKQFPKFIDDNVKLAQTVDELGQYWAQARLEMNQYFADEARGSLQTNLQENRQNSLDDLEKRFSKSLQKMMSKENWSAVGNNAASIAWSYVAGDINRKEITPLVEQLTALIWGEDASKNAINTLFSEFDTYARRYKEIIDSYNKALEEGENAIARSGLSTTRVAINDFIAKNLLHPDLLMGDTTLGEYVGSLRKMFASEGTSSNIKAQIKVLFEEFAKYFGALTDELLPWQEDVNKIIRDFNAKGKGNTGISELKLTDQIDDTIDGWKKDLDETQKSLSLIPDKYRNLKNQTYKDLKARESLLETISQNLYGNKTFDGATKAAKSEPKDAVADLKQEFQDLKELKSAYDKFKELGFNESEINRLLLNFFGVGIPEGGFNSAFENIASGLDKYGASNDAKDVRNFVSGKDWKAFYDSEKAKLDAEAKALEDYNKRIEGYIEEAKTIQQKIDDLEKKREDDLKGATTDEQRNGINFHYDTEIDKLKESLIELTSIQLTDFWQQLTGEKNGTYGNLTKLQDKARELIEVLKGIEPNRNKDGKITGYTLTQANAGNFLKSIGVDAESLQLSVAQVEALNKAFEGLFSKRAERSGIATLVDTISKGGFKDFWKQIKEGGGAATDALAAASGELSQIGGMLTQIGEAAKSDTLKSLGETFSFAGNFLGKLAKLDVIGAIGEIVNAFASWITQVVRLKAAIAEAANEAERYNSAMRLSQGVDTLFGEDAVADIRNAVAEVKKYQAAVEENRRNANREIVWRSGLFNMGWSGKSLPDMVKELGYDLYDQYGNLNAKALNAILKTYETLTEESREWIKSAIDDSEFYAAAMEQLNDAIKDTWGSIADNLADKLIDARKEVGDAYHALADDLRGVFGDVADDIAKKLVSSFINKQILSKYTNQLGEIYDMIGGGGDEEGIMSAIGSLADNIIKDSDIAADFTNRLYDAMEQAGITFEQNSQGLGNGIKSITEDTANLLASYVNAMRADLAYGKTQWERIAVAAEGYTAQFTTLNDYAARVQANTYDIAQSNRQILDRIESVITSEGGRTAIRAYM